MAELENNKKVARKFYQRATEFYNSAEKLREHFEGAVNVIDYCTALSFELKLKAILALRNEFYEKHMHHNILKLLEICKITISNKKHTEILEYYAIVLKFKGRYSSSKKGEAEQIEKVLSNMFIENNNYFRGANLTNVYEINAESGIVDDSYKEIWNILCETFEVEHKAIYS